jgi:hypothetical protein
MAGGGTSSVAQCFPSMHEALSLIPCVCVAGGGEGSGWVLLGKKSISKTKVSNKHIYLSPLLLRKSLP